MKVEVRATKVELDGVITNYLLSSEIKDDAGKVLKPFNQHIGEGKTALIKDGVLILEEVVDDWGMTQLDNYKKEVARSKPVSSEAAANREVTSATSARSKIAALKASNESTVATFDNAEKQAQLDHQSDEADARQAARDLGEEFVPTDFVPTPDTAAVAKARKDLDNLRAM